MNSFSSLLKHRRGKNPGESQRKARLAFAAAVSQSSLKLRHPSEPIPSSGKRFIIGIASYSADELNLLDRLNDSIRNDESQMPTIEVFDVLDCETMLDFEKFIPGINGVYRTPVIAVMFDGKLIDHGSGLSDVTNVLRRFNVLHAD